MQKKDEITIATSSRKLFTKLSFSKLSNISKYYLELTNITQYCSDNSSMFPDRILSQCSIDLSYQLLQSLKINTSTQFDITKKTKLLNKSIKVTYILDCVTISVGINNNFVHDKSRAIKKNCSKNFSIGLKVLNV